MSTRRKVEAPVEVVHEEPLQNKYRPQKLEHVYGQPEVVKAIRTALAAKARQHTYFLFGPGGTGKTTLARIMAAEFKCQPENIIEVDAASNSGIDQMKIVLSGMRYNGFGEQPNKAYIIDECQRLSANAWDAMLKSTEEPPAHVFFFFCSTNPAKVPGPMLTRGPNYQLQALRYDPIMDLLEDIAKEEGLATPPDVLGAVARACSGSPRNALVMLAQVQDAADAGEAEAMLEGFGQSPEVIDLCRAMVKDKLTWADVQDRLKPIAELGAEGIRIQVTLYLAAVLANCKQTQAPRLLDMLDAFSTPCTTTDKLAPIYLAFGKFTDFGGR